MPTAIEQLSALDQEIHKLVNERKVLADWIEQSEEAIKRGRIFHCMLTNAYKLRFSVTILDYLNAKLLTWKHHLPSSHFHLTLDALPTAVSTEWNSRDVQMFFMETFDAFERDWDRLLAGTSNES